VAFLFDLALQVAHAVAQLVNEITFTTAFSGSVGLCVVHGGIQVHELPAVLPLVGLEGAAPDALSNDILADAQDRGGFLRRYTSYPTVFSHVHPPVPEVRMPHAYPYSGVQWS
jgi:hypothetical protein